MNTHQSCVVSHARVRAGSTYFLALGAPVTIARYTYLHIRIQSSLPVSDALPRTAQLYGRRTRAVSHQPGWAVGCSLQVGCALASDNKDGRRLFCNIYLPDGAAQCPKGDLAVTGSPMYQNEPLRIDAYTCQTPANPHTHPVATQATV